MGGVQPLQPTYISFQVKPRPSWRADWPGRRPISRPTNGAGVLFVPLRLLVGQAHIQPDAPLALGWLALWMLAGRLGHLLGLLLAGQWPRWPMLGPGRLTISQTRLALRPVATAAGRLTGRLAGLLLRAFSSRAAFRQVSVYSLAGRLSGQPARFAAGFDCLRREASSRLARSQSSASSRAAPGRPMTSHANKYTPPITSMEYVSGRADSTGWLCGQFKNINSIGATERWP